MHLLSTGVVVSRDHFSYILEGGDPRWGPSMTLKFELGLDFFDSAPSHEVSSSYVWSFRSYRIDKKQTNPQTNSLRFYYQLGEGMLQSVHVSVLFARMPASNRRRCMISFRRAINCFETAACCLCDLPVRLHWDHWHDV